MWQKAVDLYLNRTYTNSDKIQSVRNLIRRKKMSQAATLNQEQLDRVLIYCDRTRNPIRNRTIILVTHLSGMRIGEVAALRWSDVVGLDGTIKSEVRLSADQTKGRKPRTVLLPERLRGYLLDYVRSVGQRRATSPFVNTQRSSGFTANTLTHVVNAIYRRAGIDGATSHSGRRSYITNLAERGVSARVLMSLAGHQNLSTTQRYIDIKPSMLRAAVELV
jgi:integrase/recombinase XerD